MKILRFNHNPFMSIALRKAIMVRPKLKNKCNKNRTGENWDNKAFWKTLKSYLSKKERSKLQISNSIRKK